MQSLSRTSCGITGSPFFIVILTLKVEGSSCRTYHTVISALFTVTPCRACPALVAGSRGRLFRRHPDAEGGRIQLQNLSHCHLGPFYCHPGHRHGVAFFVVILTPKVEGSSCRTYHTVISALFTVTPCRACPALVAGSRGRLFRRHPDAEGERIQLQNLSHCHLGPFYCHPGFIPGSPYTVLIAHTVPLAFLVSNIFLHKISGQTEQKSVLI